MERTKKARNWLLLQRQSEQVRATGRVTQSRARHRGGVLPGGRTALAKEGGIDISENKEPRWSWFLVLHFFPKSQYFSCLPKSFDLKYMLFLFSFKVYGISSWLDQKAGCAGAEHSVLGLHVYMSVSLLWSMSGSRQGRTGLTCLCAPGPGMVPGRAWGSIEVEWMCPGRLRKGKHWTVTLYLTDPDNCYFYVLSLICVICLITRTSCRRNFRNQAFWNSSYRILSGLGLKISEIIILKP